MHKSKLRIKKLIVILSVILWLLWDISQAGGYFISLYDAYKPASHYDAITSATTKVSMVRSDDTELANPTPITNAAID